MRIIDQHINIWEATAESLTDKLRRCEPKDEAFYKEQLDAANEVIRALHNYNRPRN